MKNKSLLAFLPLLVLASACSTVPEQQQKPVAKVVKPKQPAPVKPPIAKKPAPPVVRKDPPGTATYAIDDAKSSFKIEPSVPAMRIDPMAPPVELPSATGSADGTATPSPGSNLITPAPVVSAPVMPAYAVEDVRMPAGTSPAVVALLTEADRNRASGDLDAAVISTERALRIDSRNPALTYKLAQLRIKQNKPQLAEELAGKAALLAGSDLDLKRKSWLLIAEARRMQQNYQGAKEAKAKAESF